jgi:ABC-type multidrug transport system ATPase subunit
VSFDIGYGEVFGFLGPNGTHRLEEAERLCDRVAILKTSMLAIGRPAELRDQLFAETLRVSTVVPPPEPARVFAGLPAVMPPPLCWFESRRAHRRLQPRG